MAAPPLPACLLIDGRHMRAALDASGNPPFLHVVRALEEAFRCAFVRKEWHEGTPDGRPTPFHLELSAPEAGHVAPRIRPMQLQMGLVVAPDGQTTAHRLAIRVEKGVDVALALGMTQPRGATPLFDDYDVVVVVTGDRDLEAAFEASAATRRTYICGLRDGIAPALRRWVRSEGDRGMYLEDILARAWALATADPSPTNTNTKAPTTTTNTSNTSSSSTPVGPASHALAALASMAAPTGSPAPMAGHAAASPPREAAATHHHHHHHQAQHRHSPPPPPGLGGGSGLGPRPTTPTVGSWLAAVLDGANGGQRTGAGATPSSSSSHSAATSPSLGGRGPPVPVVEELMTSGSSRGSSLGSSLSSGGQALARAGSPEAATAIPTAAALLKGPSAGSSSSYASRILLGTSADSSGNGGVGSSADSSPALTGRSPELRPRSDDEGAAAGTAGAGGRSVETKSRRRKSAKLRLKCFAGPLCTKLKDEEHLRRTTHPCHAGLHCPILLGPDSAEKALHMERFLHPCPRGATCEIDAHEHNACFEHVGRGLLPLCTKKGCRGGDKADHATPHRHLCPHGRNCSFLSHSVADKRVIRHTASFLHPCPWGARCVAARAPGWNWEHMQSFIHGGPEAPTTTQPVKGGSKVDGGAGGGGEDALGGMGPEEVMQQLLLLQQQHAQAQALVHAPVGVGAMGGFGSNPGIFLGSNGGSSSTAELMARVLGLGLAGPGVIAEEGRDAALSSSSFDDSVVHEEEAAAFYATGGGNGGGGPPVLLATPSPEQQEDKPLDGAEDDGNSEGKEVGDGGDGDEALRRLAAFEQQFLSSFASALPKPSPADPYHSIFAPSQQELAAMPLHAAVGSGAGGGGAGSGGPHGFHHHHHHHHAHAHPHPHSMGGGF